MMAIPVDLSINSGFTNKMSHSPTLRESDDVLPLELRGAVAGVEQ